MIRYKVSSDGEDSPLKYFWYASPRNRRNLRHRKAYQAHVQSQHPLFEWCHQGVLTDMVSCTKELILDGKNVKLDDLAIFSVGIVSKKGAQSAADFSLVTT